MSKFLGVVSLLYFFGHVFCFYVLTLSWCAYRRLLADVIHGDMVLFAYCDEVEVV